MPIFISSNKTTLIKMNKESALNRLISLENEAKLLRQILEAPEKPITERVKSFLDAAEIVGTDDDERELLSYTGHNKTLISAQAYLKLSIIIKALNEDWVADFNNGNQVKYFSYFKKSGSGAVYNSYSYWHSYSVVGSLLVLKSRELAEYVGKQFAKEYNDYLDL